MIENYDQISIGNLQQVRLYAQARPLLQLWSRKRRGRPAPHNPVIDNIDRELTGDYIAVDCAGWYFENAQRKCVAIELHELTLNYYNHNVHFEYDYLTWHPTYLPPYTVLAYFSSYFKYCNLEDLLTFCRTWCKHHPKIIIGLDPTKVRYNYFRYRLLDLIAKHCPKIQIRTLQEQNFSLIFVLEHQ